jgi:hypothetical protein
MFFGVGFKEHLVLVVSAPYGNTMFEGTVEVLTVSNEKRLALLMGTKDQIDTAIQAWDAEVEAGNAVEIGELFTKANVAMLMDNAWQPHLRAPALFLAEANQVKCIPCEEDTTYTLCRPGDEQHGMMRELGRAVIDYDKATVNRAPEITEHIARFIMSGFNLSADAVIRYLNFKTNTSLAVHHGTPDTRP